MEQKFVLILILFNFLMEYAEEETEFQKKVKKIIRIAIGLFLIFLMLSWIIPTDVVRSLAEQKQIKENKIVSGKITILFEKDVYQNLKEVYLQNQLTELSLCLKGKIINQTYVISSFYQPKTFFATPISVSSNKCEDSVITLHTHPFNNCLFSYQDIISFNSYNDKKLITMIMCSIDKFATYGR